MAGQIRVGISGWTYGGWRGTFYPPGLPHKQELAHAAQRLSSIEINGTFYSLQSPKAYGSWASQAPDGFVFAVKAPRFITHLKRLKDVGTPVANFMANGLLRLGPKLGPILWQLPPSFRYDAERLERFLDLLPRDTDEAASRALAHDSRVASRLWLEAPVPKRALRHALEVRHESFRDPRLFELLRRRGVALVTADTAGKWPLFVEPTAGFAYVRLHGDEELYVNGYTPAALKSWAAKFSAWSRKGLDVYVYFDNDAKVRAPFDAMALMHLLGTGPKPPRAPSVAYVRRGPPIRGWPGARGTRTKPLQRANRGLRRRLPRLSRSKEVSR